MRLPDLGKYLYHYSAKYLDDYKRSITVDGILRTGARITTHEEYMEIKPVISPENHHKLTISSLSYLGREHE